MVQAVADPTAQLVTPTTQVSGVVAEPLPTTTEYVLAQKLQL